MPATSVRVPVHARAIRTRRRLVEAAEREFSERGYAATTARSIAERAGAATGSFYQYFVDKDAVLAELAGVRQAELVQSLQGLYADLLDPVSERMLALSEVRARLRRMVRVVVDYHRRDPALHGVICERRNADAELDAMMARGEHAIVRATSQLLERWSTHQDPLSAAFVLYGMVEGSVHAHVLGAPLVSTARFVSALVEATLGVAFPGAPTGLQSQGARRRDTVRRNRSL